MITGVHALLFAPDAEKTRAFLRDVLELPCVDAHEGWLIFALPPTELGVHPTDGEAGHELWLMCDEIEPAVAGLKAKGVEFVGNINDEGFGRYATLRIPGGGEISVYQPSHLGPLGADDR